MTPCREWQGKLDHGYGRMWRDGRSVAVHRWVMAQIHGWEALKGKVVMHRCDNPSCYRHDHLRIGTQLENIADRVAKGRCRQGPAPKSQGERHSQTRLTEEDVRTIRRRGDAGESYEVIALAYGITRTSASTIARRKRWVYLA